MLQPFPGGGYNCPMNDDKLEKPDDEALEDLPGFTELENRIQQLEERMQRLRTRVEQFERLFPPETVN